jgi:hypothetical protein
VSGHITALAISGITMIGVLFLFSAGDRIDGHVGKENT